MDGWCRHRIGWNGIWDVVKRVNNGIWDVEEDIEVHAVLERRGRVVLV